MSECPACVGSGEAFTFRGLYTCQLCEGEGEVSDIEASRYMNECEDYAAYLERKVQAE